MATFEEYLAQLQGNPEDDKRAAQSQALMLMGAGLLGGGPDRGRNISQAITGGLLGYNQGMRGALEQRQQKMAMENEARKLADYDRQQSALQGLPTGQPQMPAGMAGGPTPENASAMPPKVAPWQLAQQRGDYLSQKGLLTQAKIYYDQAEKFKPEVKERYTAKDPSGEVVDVILYKDGTQEVAKNKNATKMEFRDLGGTQAGIDPFSGRVQSSYGKTQSPDSVASNQLGWANNALTKRGQDMTDARAAQGVGEIRETPSGFVRIGKDNSVTPILEGGSQVQGKQPASVQSQIASNAVTLGKIDKAIALVDKAPDSFGLKNYLGDPIMQRADSGGVEARAIVSDIAGQKIHDRSGAAVTVGEAQRLKPYIPNATDDPSVIKKKLKMFRNEYSAMQQELASGKSLADVSSGASGWSITKVN